MRLVYNDKCVGGVGGFILVAAWSWGRLRWAVRGGCVGAGCSAGGFSVGAGGFVSTICRQLRGLVPRPAFPLAA